MTRKTDLFGRHPVAAYYALALTFSWGGELPLVAVQQDWIDVPIPLSTHYLASLEPALAALSLTALIGGRSGLAELWGRIVKWRMG